MKKFHISELENGFTITMEDDGKVVGQDDSGHAVVKRRFVAETLNEAADRVKELGTPPQQAQA